MRVLVLGGTWFLGRRVVELLHERGDTVLVVHRGHSTPHDWVPVRHLLTDRSKLADHAATVAEFDPEVVVDSAALSGVDIDAVTPVLPTVPTVVLSSQDASAPAATGSPWAWATCAGPAATSTISPAGCSPPSTSVPLTGWR